jgi:hypothetical protein
MLSISYLIVDQAEVMNPLVSTGLTYIIMVLNLDRCDLGMKVERWVGFLLKSIAYDQETSG